MRQIKVTVGTNTKRREPIVNSDTTIRQILKDEGIDYGRQTIHFDGCSLNPGDMDKTLEQMGVTGDECMIIAVTKADNAA